MEKTSRQQRRKMHRDRKDNQWFVNGWQTMKYNRSESDHSPPYGKVEIYRNEIYHCIVRGYEKMTHLSIKRLDQIPIHNWQHLQQIKNDICGNEREGIELYPAMSRIVDAANQYHLWVLPAGEKLPIGFNRSLVEIK